jgi:hypothetical protein
MRRMVDGGVINYGLLVDIKATRMATHGWLTVEARPRSVRAVAETIADLELCTLCAVTSGRSGVLAYIYAQDIEAMSATAEWISRLEGVTRVSFRQPVSVLQHRYELIVLPASDHPATWKVSA